MALAGALLLLLLLLERWLIEFISCKGLPSNRMLHLRWLHPIEEASCVNANEDVLRASSAATVGS